MPAGLLDEVSTPNPMRTPLGPGSNSSTRASSGSDGPAPTAAQPLTVQRSRSPQELVAAYRAKEWVEYAASTPYPYEHIKAVFAGLDSDIEDDVAADFR